MDADAQLLQRARSIRAGEIEPVVARAAATVALIRDAPGGLETYLLRRRPKLAFAAGMYVFPGGSVDPTDIQWGTSDRTWVGPSPQEWAGWFGTDATTAASLVGAAVRETLEETGVVLASSTVEGNPAVKVTEAERVDLEAGKITLKDLFAAHRLALRADLLAPLQHWITPETESRRYDTRFFVAGLPEGQEAREAGTEADLRVWISPEEALNSGLTLMRPTIAALSELARCSTVAEALGADRRIRPVLPRFEIVGDRVAFFSAQDQDQDAEQDRSDAEE